MAYSLFMGLVHNSLQIILVFLNVLVLMGIISTPKWMELMKLFTVLFFMAFNLIQCLDYKKCLNEIRFHGPTKFSEILKLANKYCEAASRNFIRK